MLGLWLALEHLKLYVLWLLRQLVSKVQAGYWFALMMTKTLEVATIWDIFNVDLGHECHGRLDCCWNVEICLHCFVLFDFFLSRFTIYTGCFSEDAIQSRTTWLSVQNRVLLIAKEDTFTIVECSLTQFTSGSSSSLGTLVFFIGATWHFPVRKTSFCYLWMVVFYSQVRYGCHCSCWGINKYV